MTLVSMTSMKVGSMTVSATTHLFTLEFFFVLLRHCLSEDGEEAGAGLSAMS